MKKTLLLLLLVAATALTIGAAAAPLHQTIKPGQLWPDTDGQHINAHGGGVLLHDGVYYWFGEHKAEPITPPNYGHFMLFRRFDGQWMMSVHSHTTDAEGRYVRVPRLFEVDLSGDRLVVRQ